MRLSPILYLTLRLGKYFLYLALLIGIILGAIFTFYSMDVKSLPNGSFINSHLRDKTSIVFDQSDVAHIEAKYPNDAYFALGYLHGRERPWQMEFNRRVASGTLSEILGEKTLGIDRFIRTLGIRNAARRQYESMPANTKLALEAYCNGINAGFADLGWALPPEFFLTGSKPAIWTPIDSVSWSIIFALDLGGNWSKEFQRLEMSQRLSTEQIWDVLPPYLGDPPLTSIDFANMYRQQGIFPHTETKQSAQSNAEIFAWLPQNIEGKGSNNWVISGTKTLSGKPILANDPHLGLSAPAPWYFAHLKAKELNVIGGTVPGMPGVVLGHTDKLSWGMTNTDPDVQDLYIEAIDPKNPVNYKIPTGYEAFKVRRESILVKGHEPVNFIVRETRHGPVISDALPEAGQVIDTNQYVLALRWTALDPANQSIRALIDINRASTLEEFRAALEHFYAPMQNIVMADTDGHIAYQAAGVAPRRVKGQGMMGVAPTFGWLAENDWKDYLRFDELPHYFGSDKPWVVTANHKVEDDSLPFTLTGDWTNPYRANRIEELLKKGPHSVESEMVNQNDTLSLAAKPLITVLQHSSATHPLTQQAQKILQNFDGNMQANGAAPLIFNSWVDQFTRAVFMHKLGPSFDRIYQTRGLRPALLNIVQNKKETWCDQPGTPTVETCQDLSNIALEKALTYLSQRYGNDMSLWHWGEAHVATGGHRPFGQVPILAKLFNTNIASAGDGDTVNVGKMSFKNTTEPYSSDVAPGLRAIYDMADVDQSIFIGFGGQSGWVQSKRYREYMDLWAHENYLPLTLHPTEFKPYKIELNPR
jgi:penicillin G amidase